MDLEAKTFDRLMGMSLRMLSPAGKPSPALEDYETGGSPWVINLLHINGEQQVTLRVVVAEVNRAAARSIGVDFSILNHSGRAVFANNTGSISTGVSSS